MSLKAIAAAYGKYSSVVADVRRAFAVTSNTAIAAKPRSELEREYRYPKSIEDVAETCNLIANYSEGNVDPENWVISVDTETNTLHPHRDGTKLLMVSIAWSTGLATAIPLWHPQNDLYDPEAAWQLIKALLESKKPKMFHNLKYDVKVFRKYGCEVKNIIWDCMLAEHALEEDKKGQYGLKYLVRQYLPEYSGYEDQLHEILVKSEGEDQRQSINEMSTDKSLPLPTLIKDALDSLELTPKFRVSTLEESVAEWETFSEATKDYDTVPKDLLKEMDAHIKRLCKRLSSDRAARTAALNARIAAAKLVLNAKKAGEFTEKKKNDTHKKKIEDGFSKIPLEELSFYAAVDADATRQLGIQQFGRIHQEDDNIEKRRAEVTRNLRFNRVGGPPRKVEVLCTGKNPLVSLVKNGYVKRAEELARMEYGGVKVDRAFLQNATVKLDHVIKQQEELIYELAGARFNISSSQQLGNYLFDTGVGYLAPSPEKAEALSNDPMYRGKVTWNGLRIMYRPELYTARGQAQVNEATLKIYATKYGCPLADAVLVYRKAIKARDTFLSNVDQLSSLDGLLHTSYNPNGTSTGRLSSNNMNMQNIPTGAMGAIPESDPRYKLMAEAERDGVKCKCLFIPDDDSMCFINADAKGAEVSMFAGYARDQNLIAALRGGLDAHCFFSSKVLNPDKVAAGLTGSQRKLALEKAGIDDDHAWSYEDFLLGKDGLLEEKKYGSRLKKLRNNIKRVVFGILFGAGGRKVAEIAGIEEAFARTIIELLFSEFPTIPSYIDNTKWELRTFGFVETYFGRRRRFAIDNAPRQLLSQAERRAVNFKIQATSSDIVMDVLTWIAPIIERDFGGRLLLTVHDSIGFQVPKKYVGQVKDLMRKYGTDRVRELNPWLPVDYKWDVEAGENYGQLYPIDDYVQRIARKVQFEPAGYTSEDITNALRDAVLLGAT